MVAVLVAVGVIGLLVTGCGGDTKVDIEAAERRIADSLADRYDLSVSQPDCGDDAPSAAEGTRFACRVRLNDEAVVVDVTVTGDDTDLSVRPRVAVLATDEIIADLRERLGERFARDRLEVSCPGPAMRVLDPGEELTCEASDPGTEATVVVRARDRDGTLTYTVR